MCFDVRICLLCKDCNWWSSKPSHTCHLHLGRKNDLSFYCTFSYCNLNNIYMHQKTTWNVTHDSILRHIWVEPTGIYSKYNQLNYNLLQNIFKFCQYLYFHWVTKTDKETAKTRSVCMWLDGRVVITITNISLYVSLPSQDKINVWWWKRNLYLPWGQINRWPNYQLAPLNTIANSVVMQSEISLWVMH